MVSDDPRERTHDERDQRDEADERDRRASADRPPAAPSKDDPTPLGDTDQHSDSDA